MIEINLLPVELKEKSKKNPAELKKFVVIFPLLGAILVIINIFLILFSIIQGGQLRALNNKWNSLESQRNNLQAYKKEADGAASGEKSIQQLVKDRITWSERLNKISLYLPSGLWLDEMVINSGKDFLVRGSVISLQKEEMGQINKFIDSLKNDSSFFEIFAGLELSSMQSRSVSGYDIVDFVLTGSLKP